MVGPCHLSSVPRARGARAGLHLGRRNPATSPPSPILLGGAPLQHCQYTAGMQLQAHDNQWEILAEFLGMSNLAIFHPIIAANTPRGLAQRTRARITGRC
eukprot:1480963-Heterocapsa_arctica.AAC.1